MEGVKISNTVTHLQRGIMFGYRFDITLKAHPRIKIEATIWAKTLAELEAKFQALRS